jgi:hypothetical protein
MAVRLSALRTGHTLLPRNIIILMLLVLISVIGRINPWTMMRLEGLGKLKRKKKKKKKKSKTLSGLEPATSRFVALCLSQLRY